MWWENTIEDLETGSMEREVLAYALIGIPGENNTGSGGKEYFILSDANFSMSRASNSKW